MGRLLALVGGEHGVVFALPPAVAETVGARLVLTDDDVIKNLHNKRTRNNSNVARRCHYFRQLLLAKNTVSN